VDDGAGANWCFVNGTVRVNSQSQKNRGKITISIQNKGTNARAPNFNINIYSGRGYFLGK